MASGKYNKKSIAKLFILITLIAIGIFFFRSHMLQDYLTPSNLVAFVKSYGSLAPLIFIIFYIFGTVFAFPGSILTITAGLLFGPLFGTIYTNIGSTLGASLAFLLSRYLGRDFINKFENLHKSSVGKIDEYAAEHGFKTILFLRLIPLVPFVGLNYAAGLSKIKFRDFFFGTLLGTIPGTFAYVYLGSNLMQIFSINFIIALILVITLSVAPRIYKKYTSKKTSP
jgi:uncharacterized membrane protein YdjX (TVP38/TMEM64 family)